jgi:hypothetical protein
MNVTNDQIETLYTSRYSDMGRAQKLSQQSGSFKYEGDLAKVIGVAARRQAHETPGA